MLPQRIIDPFLPARPGFLEVLQDVPIALFRNQFLRIGLG